MPASSHIHRLNPGDHVCHFTVVHDANDVRILERQIRTLTTADFTVTYIARGQLKRNVEGCDHHELKVTGTSAVARLRAQLRGWLLATRAGARTIVLHDPELLPIGILVQLGPFGRRVIFDCHEDYSTKMRERTKNQVLGRAFSYSFSVLASLFGAAGGHFLAPTEHIRAKLGERRTTLISNVPTTEMKRSIIQALAARKNPRPTSLESTEIVFLYAGMISAERNLSSWIDCLDQYRGVQTKVMLAGPCASNAKTWLAESSGRGAVDYLGNLPFDRLPDHLAQADIGVIVLPKKATYELAHPTKLFEYLLSGLPVVLSDFDEWRSLVDKCGGAAFYCDPTENTSVTSALREAASFSTVDTLQTRRDRARRASIAISWDSDADAYIKRIAYLAKTERKGETRSRHT